MHTLFATDPDGWIDASALKEFPILKSLRCSEYDIIEICRNCDFFVVDSGKIRRNFNLYPNLEIMEQLSTRSATPPGSLSPVDRRTVCIDGLSALIKTHEVKLLILDQFDVDIRSVSVPRHPVTGEGYGCAFVELSAEEEARLLVRKLKKLINDKIDLKFRNRVVVMTMGKFHALKSAYKKAKSLAIVNRLDYYPEYATIDPMTPAGKIQDDYDDVASPSEEDDGSSLMSDSGINSLAQDSVEIRRATNASSIRSNSVVYIDGLPNTDSRTVLVWLSHSAAVQFLDHQFGQSFAHVRFASRRERDFFIRDFHNSKIPILGCFPSIKPLSPEECIDYFEAERERRRSMIHSLGHPDSWSLKKSQKLETPDRKTTIPILRGWKSKRPGNGIAFTDTIAGNATCGEPGSSALFGIKKGRHVARQMFLEALEKDEEDVEPKRERDEPGDERNGEKRRRLMPKKTRRGCRGGKRKHLFYKN